MSKKFLQLQAMIRSLSLQDVADLSPGDVEFLRALAARGTPAPRKSAPPEFMSDAVTAEVHRDRKITAIKILREETGMGLADAKNALEAFFPRMRHTGG